MGLILLNDKIALPQRYPKVVRKLPVAQKDGSVTFGDFSLRKDIDFAPQPGLQEDVCASDCNLIFMCGQGTAGKAQPYDAHVLTPNGFVEMGSLQVGDVICGSDGKPQTVLKIFEQGLRDVYELQLKNGRKTECDIEHLWTINFNDFGTVTVSTSQILNLIKLGCKIKVPFRHPDVDKLLFSEVKHIEKVARKQCRCILVSNPDHLYITDNYIVTHNTFSMYFKALGGMEKYGFTARLISVRALDSKKGSSIFRDGVTVCGNFANCEYSSSEIPTFAWTEYNSNLQLIHSNFNVTNPKEWEEFMDYAKKQQAALIMVDEATEMKEFKMFTFWFMRNRDASGMIPQMILSFNPLHEHWTTTMLVDAGYVDTDTWLLKPEMIGQVRYFYNKGDNPSEIIWGNTREEVAKAAGLQDKPEDVKAGITCLDYVKSFTVFTGTAADNRELVRATGGQSVANLHAVGKTQRAVVGEAYFGPTEHEELGVTRQMLHNLWTNPIDNDENMYATMDVSGGSSESDDCPMIIWRGLRIVNIKFFRGNPKELVRWIDNILTEYNVPIEHFAFDATGIGYYLKAYTSGMPVTANKKAIQELDENGNPILIEQYFNLRSQLLGKTKVLFEKGEISIGLDKDTIIPYGKNGSTRKLFDVLCDEIHVFTSLSRNKKIYYRSKDEYKAKFHSSPDLIDAISLRAVFELDARPKKQPQAEIADDAYDALFSEDYDTSFFQ
jgi:hypothetical protein